MAKKGECRTGEYTTNVTATRGALVCVGGFGQPQCKLLEECVYIKDDHFRYVNLYQSKNGLFFIVECGVDGTLSLDARGKSLTTDKTCMLGFNINNFLDKLKETEY